MSDAQVRSKTPKLIAITLILTVIAAGVTFSFQKESSMLRGLFIRGWLSKGEEEIETPHEQQIRKKDPEAEARTLVIDAIWYEDTGNAAVAQRKYRECIERYPETKSGRNAQKLLKYSIEDSQKPQPSEHIAESPKPSKKVIPKADRYYNEAIIHMKKAYSFKPSGERNREFEKAESLFRKAIAIWGIQNEGHCSSKIERKLIKANEQLYSCLKYRTLHK